MAKTQQVSPNGIINDILFRWLSVCAGFDFVFRSIFKFSVWKRKGLLWLFFLYPSQKSKREKILKLNSTTIVRSLKGASPFLWLSKVHWELRIFKGIVKKLLVNVHGSKSRYFKARFNSFTILQTTVISWERILKFRLWST